MQINDPTINAIGQACVCYFSSPKAPAAPKPQTLPEPPAAPVIPIPKPPKPLPPPAPPPTESKLEVQEAQDEQRRQALSRRGFRASILAGESGANSATGRKSILG